MKLSFTEKIFDVNFPKKRLKITQHINRELNRIKRDGFPNYPLNNRAVEITKTIINILTGDDNNARTRSESI